MLTVLSHNQTPFQSFTATANANADSAAPTPTTAPTPPYDETPIGFNSILLCCFTKLNDK